MIEDGVLTLSVLFMDKLDVKDPSHGLCVLTTLPNFVG